MRMHRAGIGLVVLLAVAALAVALVVSRGSSRADSVLPATPMAWLDAFSAGVARDSGDVCSRLLSSEFRAAMQRDAHESCAAYYGSMQVLSVRVLRILRLGETAAIEIRYFPRGGYSTFVLDRLARGWQAVAIVPVARCRSPELRDPARTCRYRARPTVDAMTALACCI
jgi:hypothetical protein